MFRKILLVLSLGICFTTGWFFGYVNFPMIENSFILEFALCCSILGIIGYYLFVNSNFNGFEINKNLTSKKGKSKSKTYFFLALLAVVVFVFAAVRINVENNLKIKLSESEELIKEQENQILRLKSKNQLPAVARILGNLKEEIDTNNGTLSEGSIREVANLSHTLEPYFDPSLSKKISIERGNLFVGLCALKMDSNSFAKIKRDVVFSFSYLKDVDLSGLDLTEVNLEYCTFLNVNLNEADLSNSNLFRGDFSGSTFDSADLKNAYLNHAVCKDALFNNGNFQKASLDGGDFSHAQFGSANMTNASVDFANFSGSLFNKAILKNVSFIGTELVGCNFDNSYLSQAKVLGGNVSMSSWNKAVVSSDWVEILEGSKSIGVDNVLETYTLDSKLILSQGDTCHLYKIR